MSFTTEFFVAQLTSAIKPADTYLPMGQSAEADLVSLLSGGDYTLLALSGDTEYEIVRMELTGGRLIVERGLGGTRPAYHHYGTRVRTVEPLVVAAMQEIMKN